MTDAPFSPFSDTLDRAAALTTESFFWSGNGPRRWFSTTEG